MGTQEPKTSILYVQYGAFTQAGYYLKDGPIAAMSLDASHESISLQAKSCLQVIPIRKTTI